MRKMGRTMEAEDLLALYEMTHYRMGGTDDES